MKKRLIKNVAISMLSATLVTLTSCGSKDDQAAQAAAMMGQAPQIGTMKVDYGTVDFSKAYPATVKGKTDIEIRPQVSGFITQVLVDEGQHVTKGQTLFVIDQVQYQAAVDQAAAAVESARAAVNSATTRVNTAKLTAEQKQSLFNKNIISEYENQLAKNDLATAQSGLATAKAALAQAEAALTSAKKNLAYTTVTAPSNGVIGSIPFREGSLASPSMVQPLTTVSDNGEVYAYFSLTEKDILDLTDNGSKSLNQAIAEMPAVEFRMADGATLPVTGKVATVSGLIGTGTGASTVRALFNNPGGVLRSGSTGQVVFPTRSNQVITVPQSATFEVQNERFVYVVNDSNKVVPTRIVVSPIQDGKVFIVEDGLKLGQTIAVEGIGTKLQPNMEIKPVDARKAAAEAAAAQQQK